MPDVVDRRTYEVVKKFGYTEQDLMDAEDFASRSPNYVVKHRAIRGVGPHEQRDRRNTAYTDSQEHRYPTVPGGNPVASMAAKGAFKSVSPELALQGNPRGSQNLPAIVGGEGEKWRGGGGLTDAKPLSREGGMIAPQSPARSSGPVGRRAPVEPEVVAEVVSDLINQVMRRRPPTNSLLPRGVPGTPEGNRIVGRRQDGKGF
jgi:hypothetical protein